MSDMEVLEAVERVCTWAEERGRFPAQLDFNEYSKHHRDGVSVGTIHRRFGEFTGFLERFALWTQGDISIVQLTQRKNQNSVRSSIPNRIRYEVIKESENRCRNCGATAGLAALQVDHITPVCKGGTNEKRNLQVLCQACNFGKGGRIAERNPPLVRPRTYKIFIRACPHSGA